MQKLLKPEERLIVAADFQPPAHLGRDWVKANVLNLADKLRGTGVVLKVNSALRACGYSLIDEIKSCSLQVFADLKLCDIGATLAIDGSLLKEAKPDIVTAMCTAGTDALLKLRTELSHEIQILGITVLTSLSGDDSKTLFGADVGEAVERFAGVAFDGRADGVVCSPKEIEQLREIYYDDSDGEGVEHFSLVTPGIRPKWVEVQGDDQNKERTMTPGDAIRAGADRIVVGRPILQAKDPYAAVMRTIEEIAEATAAT